MSDFPALDAADTQQIVDADAVLKQSLAYDLRGKKQISYAGIKWLVLNMSKDEPLAIDIHEITLDKSDDAKSEWTWYATVKCRNGKTGLETLGASEQPYLLNSGARDPFGRTKALSKAERNAYRKQIPELEIQNMLNAVDPTQVRRLHTPAEPRITSGPSAPTIEQVQELKDLGIKTPPTRFEAAKMIALAKKELNQEQ